jgi:replication-associated recombination protein RarA
MFEVDLQSDLGFPEELAEKYRPHSLDEFIGLADVKKVMAKYIARPYPTSWIFLGPSFGTGFAVGVIVCLLPSLNL